MFHRNFSLFKMVLDRLHRKVGAFQLTKSEAGFVALCPTRTHITASSVLEKRPGCISKMSYFLSFFFQGTWSFWHKKYSNKRCTKNAARDQLSLEVQRQKYVGISPIPLYPIHTVRYIYSIVLATLHTAE